MEASDHRRLLHAYKKAEDTIHSLGIETDEGVDTAAVNELRYAGRHILDGLNAEDSDERGKQFRRAEDHCERAMYEAYDSAIYYHFAYFHSFKKDYSRIPISDTLPDFISMEETIQKAKRFLETARQDEDNRQGYYEQAATVYEGIEQVTSRLEAARDELNKKVMEYNRGAESEAKARMGRELTTKITIIIGVATIVTNLVVALVRIWVS